MTRGRERSHFLVCGRLTVAALLLGSLPASVALQSTGTFCCRSVSSSTQQPRSIAWKHRNIDLLISHASLSSIPSDPGSRDEPRARLERASNNNEVVKNYVLSNHTAGATSVVKAVLKKLDPRVGRLGYLKVLPFALLPVLLECVEVQALGLDWRPFVAGGLSTAFAHGITTPFDVVKTRMQTNPEMYDGSIVKAYRRIVRTEGAVFLWQGLGPTVVGYFFEGALKIGVYELLKYAPFLTGSGLVGGFFQSSELARFVFAGCVSGLVASLVLCPVEEARIRMVAEPDFLLRACPTTTSQGDYEDDEEHELWCEVNELQATLELIEKEGFAEAYSGMGPMLLKQVPYTVTKQGSFDYFTALSYRALSPGAGVNPLFGGAVTLGCAGVASVLSSLTSQPGDVLLTAAYKDGKSSKSKSKRKSGTGPVGNPDNYVDADETVGVRTRSKVRKAIADLPKLFVGTKARLIHVGFMNTLQLFAYDLLRVVLGMGASGRR